MRLHRRNSKDSESVSRDRWAFFVSGATVSDRTTAAKYVASQPPEKNVEKTQKGELERGTRALFSSRSVSIMWRMLISLRFQPLTTMPPFGWSVCPLKSELSLLARKT